MLEYVEYKPEENKQEPKQEPEPETSLSNPEPQEPVKEPGNNEIDNALSIMQSVQCDTQEPVQETPEPQEPEPQEPVKEPEPQEPEYLKFKHSSTFFKRIFKTLNTVCNEAKLSFTSEKINTVVVDPAHVMMLTIDIPVNAIEEYKVIKDMSLGFDLDKLGYILKTSGKNDMFEFLYDSDKNEFKAFIKNGLFNHTYTLIDTVGLPEPKIPTPDLPVKIKINTKLLHDFLVQAEKISDHVIIRATRDNLTLSAIGDSDQVNITLDRDQLALYHCDGTYQSLFSVDYFLSIVKQLKTLFDELTLDMGNDNPIRITGDNGYKAEVLLAPRIESE